MANPLLALKQRNKNYASAPSILSSWNNVCCIFLHQDIKSFYMTKRIHILEDDSDIRYIIEYLLKDQGYELHLSSSLSELKTKLRDSLPDLFIIDVMLPDGNGIEICDDLKNDMFTRHIPVIVMSANPRSKQMSTQACADDYISKPFDLDDVVTRINNLLEKKPA